MNTINTINPAPAAPVMRPEVLQRTIIVLRQRKPVSRARLIEVKALHTVYFDQSLPKSAILPSEFEGEYIAAYATQTAVGSRYFETEIGGHEFIYERSADYRKAYDNLKAEVARAQA